MSPTAAQMSRYLMSPVVRKPKQVAQMLVFNFKEVSESLLSPPKRIGTATQTTPDLSSSDEESLTPEQKHRHKIRERLMKHVKIGKKQKQSPGDDANW